MNRKPIIILFIVIALVTMSCGISIHLPVTQVKTGPTQTDTINVPMPGNASDTVDLSLSFGAGKLKLNPGAQDGLVSGKATYNVPDFKPEVNQDGQTVTIEQGNLNIEGFPSFKDNVENTWDFQLASVPMNLTVKAGAYEGTMELGGLDLRELEVSDGASTVDLSFNKPNLGEMNYFRYTTGASTVNLTGLGNANFNTMVFKGGAGSYKLDFSGDLKQNATVTVDSGVSSVVIVVPENVNAKVSFSGGLSSVDASNSWSKSGDTYTQKGTGPTLTIKVTIGAGSLTLRNP